jgi:DNA-binding transcriptional MerR regulator
MARRLPEPKDLLSVAQAAKLLGVSVPTLRRWDDAGKFVARRHPINRYRQYAVHEVQRLRKKILDGRPA